MVTLAGSCAARHAWETFITSHIESSWQVALWGFVADNADCFCLFVFFNYFRVQLIKPGLHVSPLLQTQ